MIAHLRRTPPPGTRAELFDLYCRVVVDRLPSQVFLVSVRTDWRTSTVANEPSRLQCSIAEGTDHLLYACAAPYPRRCSYEIQNGPLTPTYAGESCRSARQSLRSRLGTPSNGACFATCIPWPRGRYRRMLLSAWLSLLRWTNLVSAVRMMLQALSASISE